ncbi:MAG TPA: hypothetical protein PLP17_12425, partial [Oligoflexia bacterium]|nr:hypothetical protein [Oligoflexia bacterium]
MADDGLTEADALDMPELRAEQLDLSGSLEPKASSAEACNELLQPSEPELSGASELEVTRQRHELRPGRKMRRPGVRLAADDTPQTANLAPMLRQYLQIKREYPEHLLLFQVGDFYEIFFDDAKTAANFLQIRLTSRDKESPDPVPMCGVPVHALDNYLPRLLKGGYSCVIVSQAEDAKDKKGMVRREISRIVTPGIRYEGDGLDEKQFNYLAAVCVAGGDGSGAVCYVDVSTGHLRVQETESVEELTEVLERIRPAELLLPSLIFSVAAEKSQPWLREVRRICGASGCRVVQRPFDRTTKAEVQKRMGGLFPKTGENGAAGMIAQNTARLSPVALSVVQTLVGYVEEVSFGSSASMSQFSIEEPRRSVFIDAATRRNLEICETRLDGDRRNSLLYHIDYSRTPMGTRLLADWLLVPSANRSELEARYDALEELMHESGVLEELRSLLAAVRDVDRLLSRITSGRASPRDLSALGESLAVLPVVRRCCSGFAAEMLREVLGQIDALEDIQQQISAA